jgi:hypothetical protein
MTRPSYDQLLKDAAALKITVKRAHMNDLGLYDHDARTIWIHSALTDTYAAPVLAHELAHAYRGDNCAQPDHVEQAIDHRVARAFISDEEYARLEAIYGGDATAIADELSLPRWVVSAFQEYLRLTR